MTGDAGAAYRFFASWLERLPASVDFAHGDVLEFADLGALTVTGVYTSAAVFPDEEDELRVSLDDGRDRSQMSGPVRRWPSAGDDGDGGRPAEHRVNSRSGRTGPPGGPDGTRPVRFDACWTERLPADARFVVGGQVELEDVGSLPIVRVSTRAKVRQDSETLHLVWLDDGTVKYTFEEHMAELKRQYWRKVHAKGKR